MLPHVAPSGCYWRCEFHLKGKSQKALYRYSSSSGRKYLQDHCGGSIRKEVSPAFLAKAIMLSVPQELKSQCRGGVSPEVARWLDELESALSNGFVPQAFHEYTTDFSLWELADITRKLEPSHIHPQPGYIRPGTELHWSQEQFWRNALNNWEALRKVDEISFRSSHIDSAVATSSIASELHRAMKDNDEVDAERLFKAAIAALHDSFHYSPD